MAPTKVVLGFEPDVPTVNVYVLEPLELSTTALPVPLLDRPLMVWFWPDRSNVAVFGEVGFKATMPLLAPFGMAVALPGRSMPWVMVVFPAYVFPLEALLNVTVPLPPLVFMVTQPAPVTAPDTLMLPEPVPASKVNESFRVTEPDQAYAVLAAFIIVLVPLLPD